MQNIEEIYKEHSNAVYKYLFCLTGNEDLSEDITQETFCKAITHIKNKKRKNSKTEILWILNMCFMKEQIQIEELY